MLDAALASRRRAAAVPRARRASTRSSPRSRSARTRCSPATSSRPTTPTRSRRSPASCRCRPCAVSTGCRGSRRCRPTSTARATTSRPKGSHVLPALIRRYDEAAASGAAVVTNWGTGTPRREFLHVDDMADAVPAPARALRRARAGQRRHRAPTSRSARSPRRSPASSASPARPSGTRRSPTARPQKLLDVSKLAEAGWTSSISLEAGLERTVAWYREHVGALRE